ncbi:MAG: hypothetical protein K6E46_07885 [Lachnospiraceae bacterium]|nr:hypothetical protein [Lachnospiraceae bacterium]
MDIEGWKYYNHAAIPTVAPHKKPDLRPVEDGSIWRIGGNRPLFARWTEEYDCKQETNWWYTVLDRPFDITRISSKSRQNINKGKRLFEVKEINPLEHCKEILDVTKAAYTAYPLKYRPSIDEEEVLEMASLWQEEVDKGEGTFYAAYFRESGELCGYHFCRNGEGHIATIMMKVNPVYEKYQINAALIEKWVTDAESFVKEGGYLTNGERNVNHQTAFNDYLGKYFEFRRVYCRLKLIYRPEIKPVVKFLYIFRRILRVFDGIEIIHLINAVLKMEEIAREREV